MALNSPILEAFIAEMARVHDADSVILEPVADKVWQYNRQGKILQSGVSPLDIDIKGKRLYCLPGDKPGSSHSCTLYDKNNQSIEEFKQKFPDKEIADEW